MPKVFSITSGMKGNDNDIPAIQAKINDALTMLASLGIHVLDMDCVKPAKVMAALVPLDRVKIVKPGKRKGRAVFGCSVAVFVSAAPSWPQAFVQHGIFGLMCIWGGDQI